MKTLVTFVFASALAGFGFFPVHAQTSTGDKTPSTVDGKADLKAGQKQDPGTVGGMNNAVGDRATSAQDVQRQTEGKPTMAQEGKGERPAEGTKPGITQNSPGTVGAAPGTTPPMNNEKR